MSRKSTILIHWHYPILTVLVFCCVQAKAQSIQDIKQSRTVSPVVQISTLSPVPDITKEDLMSMLSATLKQCGIASKKDGDPIIILFVFIHPLGKVARGVDMFSVFLTITSRKSKSSSHPWERSVSATVRESALGSEVRPAVQKLLDMFATDFKAQSLK